MTTRDTSSADIVLTPQETLSVPRKSRSWGASKAIRERFADGKWRTIESMIAALPQFPEQSIREPLRRAGGGVPGVKREVRQRGRTMEYRLFPIDKTVSCVELAEKLGPLITRLREQGRTNMATVSIGTIADIAHQLAQHLKEWTR